MVAGCKPAPSMSLSPSSVDVASEGGKVEIAISANYGWKVESSESWVRFGNKVGTEYDTVLQITVSANDTPDDREAIVTVTCEDVVQTVKIHQSQQDMVVPADGREVTLPSKAQQVELEIEANVDYSAEVSTEASWIRIIGTKALKNSSVIIAVEANEGHSSREATIVFKAGGQIIKELAVTQEGLPQIMKVVHTLSSFDAPKMFGFGMKGTISWGDGSKEEYDIPLHHDYATEGPHEVVVEITEVIDVSMPDVVGIEKVDLSEF